LVVLLGWLGAGPFGLWVGIRQRNPSFTRHVIPIGALLGLATLPAATLWPFVGNEQASLLGQLKDIFESGLPYVLLIMPTWLIYVFGVLVGNAWQRGRTGRISGTTPASPVPRRDWTPRHQAILGWTGTIISALLGLLGTIIAVTMGQ
jgi:hypothetical protein